MNFQMFKLDLEKVEEPEIKLPTPSGSSKKQESLKKKKTYTSTLFIEYAKAFDCVDHNKLFLLDLHTDFSGGRSGGLVFPSFEEFSTVCCDSHSQRLWLVNKAEIGVFLEPSCFYDDPTDVGNLISGSFAFSKSSLNMWKVSFHVLLKPGLENSEHYFGSM